MVIPTTEYPAVKTAFEVERCAPSAPISETVFCIVWVVQDNGFTAVGPMATLTSPPRVGRQRPCACSAGSLASTRKDGQKIDTGALRTDAAPTTTTATIGFLAAHITLNGATAAALGNWPVTRS